MPQSCMSLHRFGMTQETVGSLAKSAGKLGKGCCAAVDTFLKAIQGTCLAAYLPAEQTVEPTDGRSSEYPVKLRPAATRSAPRFGAMNRCGQLSSVTP